MRWALFAGSAAFAVVAMAYDQYDKKTNFQPVNARISAVNDQCYMEKVERGVLTKTTLTSDPLNCDLAKVLKREHPKWQGFAIRRKIEVRFDYVSPVDRTMHTSSQQMSAFPNDRPLHVGDTLPILASKTDETHTI